MVVFGINSQKYKSYLNGQVNKNSGAYHYAFEVENNILPKIKKKVFIVTAGATLYKSHEIPNHAIVICHDNRYTKRSYRHLLNKDILWICSKKSTVETLESYGEKAAYIPLSIDTKLVKKYIRKKKTKDIAYVGNPWSFKRDYLNSLPDNIDQLNGMDRIDLLKSMSKYKRIIAEGRCLMEAQILGAECEVPKYKEHEAVFVKPFDNKDALPEWDRVLSLHAKNLKNNRTLKCIKRFFDLETGKNRIIGEIFFVSKDRAEELLSNKNNLVRLV